MHGSAVKNIYTVRVIYPKLVLSILGGGEMSTGRCKTPRPSFSTVGSQQIISKPQQLKKKWKTLI